MSNIDSNPLINMGLFLVLTWASEANAQIPFLDTFENGDSTVTWSPGSGASAVRSNVNGSYRMSGTGIATSFPTSEPVIEDGVLSTQLRIVSGETFAGVFGRSGEDGISTYFAVIDHTGLFGLGEATADGQIETSDQIQTDLNPTESDVLVRLAMVGNTISADVWEFGESIPIEPMLSTIDDTLDTGGFGVLINSGAGATVDFRFFEAVPEPASWALGCYLVLPMVALLRTRRRK